jgi:hypothetical protein
MLNTLGTSGETSDHQTLCSMHLEFYLGCLDPETKSYRESLAVAQPQVISGESKKLSRC